MHSGDVLGVGQVAEINLGTVVTDPDPHRGDDAPDAGIFTGAPQVVGESNSAPGADQPSHGPSLDRGTSEAGGFAGFVKTAPASLAPFQDSGNVGSTVRL